MPGVKIRATRERCDEPTQIEFLANCDGGEYFQSAITKGLIYFRDTRGAWYRLHIISAARSS